MSRESHRWDWQLLPPHTPRAVRAGASGDSSLEAGRRSIASRPPTMRSNCAWTTPMVTSRTSRARASTLIATGAYRLSARPSAHEPERVMGAWASTDDDGVHPVLANRRVHRTDMPHAATRRTRSRCRPVCRQQRRRLAFTTATGPRSSRAGCLPLPDVADLALAAVRGRSPREDIVMDPLCSRARFQRAILDTLHDENVRRRTVRSMRIFRCQV